jgi:hypothetical protein
MTLPEAFDEHFKLIVGVQAGKPLQRSVQPASPNESDLAAALDILEGTMEFIEFLTGEIPSLNSIMGFKASRHSREFYRLAYDST